MVQIGVVGLGMLVHREPLEAFGQELAVGEGVCGVRHGCKMARLVAPQTGMLQNFSPSRVDGSAGGRMGPPAVRARGRRCCPGKASAEREDGTGRASAAAPPNTALDSLSPPSGYLKGTLSRLCAVVQAYPYERVTNRICRPACDEPQTPVSLPNCEGRLIRLLHLM